MKVNLRALILSIFQCCFGSIAASAQSVETNQENTVSSSTNKAATADFFGDGRDKTAVTRTAEGNRAITDNA